MRIDPGELAIDDLSDEQRELLKLLLEQEGMDVTESLAFPRRPPGAAAPLSYAQRRLWFTDQLAAKIGVKNPNNNPHAWRLLGALNVSALEQSFGELTRRHEILRTTCEIEDGEPRQVVTPPSPFTLPLLDLGHLAQWEREATVRQHAAEEAHYSFNLQSGPLLRATLLRLSQIEHVLLLTTHFFVADGTSEGILLDELSALYRAFAADISPPLAELPIQYADFTLWQREWFHGDVRDRQLAYWKEQLRGSPARLNLMTDRLRPAEPTFNGAWLSFAFPVELSPGYERSADVKA